MIKLKIDILPALSDNYIYMLHDITSDLTAAIDPSDENVVFDYLEKTGRTLTHILNTHHHWDHTDGNLPLKKKTDCIIVGSADDEKRIPGIDVKLHEGDEYVFGNFTTKILATSGHTVGSIAFYFESEEIVFTGDTFFTMGCGKLFEGTPEQMHESLSKIKNLPDNTKIYSGHEYAQSNAKFALSVEPNNKNLLNRIEKIDLLREQGEFIQPTTIKEEKLTNPFIRTESEEIRKLLEMNDNDSAEVFAEIRRRKDSF